MTPSVVFLCGQVLVSALLLASAVAMHRAALAVQRAARDLRGVPTHITVMPTGNGFASIARRAQDLEATISAADLAHAARGEGVLPPGGNT